MITITKTFNYRGDMLSYLKKASIHRNIFNCKTTLDQRTKKYTLTYNYTEKKS